MADDPALDIVIVSYRCAELLIDCLESIRAAGPADRHRVIVVDNASGDGTPAAVRTGFPEVELVEASRNLGFAAASNHAIRRGDAPYVLILNPDTRLRPGVLDALLALMDSRPEVGICGCRLERDDGSFDHAARRSFPTFAGAFGHLSGLGRAGRAPARLAQYRAPEAAGGPVDAVNGAFMLVRRAALDEVGLFDEAYWMYFEDLDLCYRFAQAGWVTWYEPSHVVSHVKHGTTGPYRRPRLDAAFHGGMARFYRSHYARAHSAPVNLAAYAGIGAAFVFSLVRNGVGRALART